MFDDGGELHLYRTSERPDIGLWLEDSNGNLINFSTGYTFEFKLGTPGETAVLTKTTGIAGAVGSGSDPDGVPNVVIGFNPGELDDVPKFLDPHWQLRATSSASDRIYQGPVVIHDVIL